MLKNNVSDINTTLTDAQFKDDSPIKTVERIKQILASHNIKTTEKWAESGVDYCFSLRVSVDGTKFGTNGKGLTKEFALASAYGELMERMQLGLFGDSSVQKLGYFNYATGADTSESVDFLYEELPYWYDYLANKVNEIDKDGINGKRILSRFAVGNKIDAVNTMEEAIVQAVSEIVERHYKLRIMRERVSLPEIPEEVLKSFPTAYKIIENVRCKGYRVSVKDCSLETAFPVVCVCYINEDTGKYHTHFGAYPVLEIAIERALTESFQGRNIESFAENEDFLYGANDLLSYQNIYRDLKKGDYLKTPEFFVGECKYKYNRSVGFIGNNNAELLKQVVDFFDKQGCEILVRDASSLGFPTYNVFIPTYSEVVFYGLSKKYFSNPTNSKKAVNALRDLSKVGAVDLMFLLVHIEEIKRLSSIDKKIFSFTNCTGLKIDCDQALDSYMMLSSLAYIYYSINDLAQALLFVEKLIPVAEDKELKYLLCLKRYLAMRVNGYDEEYAKKLVAAFHCDDTVQKLNGYIDSKENPLSDFILHCDQMNCESCKIKEYCKYKYTQTLIDLVNEGARKVDFDGFVHDIKKYSTSKS